VKAETYDYTNDTWNPLSGASIGATQPNPADPYSPLVISSVTSGSDGTAQMSLETPGTYAVGLAIDYYFPTEALTITAPVPEASTSTDDTPAESAPPSSSGRSSARREAAASAASVATIEAATSTPVVAETAAELREIIVTFDIPVAEFIERYNAALAVAQYRETSVQTVADDRNTGDVAKPLAAVPEKSQAAAVVEVVKTGISPLPAKNWFSSLLDLFSF
jgi:hypothetical protein